MLINVKVERVVGLRGVVGVTRLRLGPRDDLAHVLNKSFAFGNVLHGEHALAVHARAAGLDAATRFDDFFVHWGTALKIWYRELVWVRVCVPTCMCERPGAREKWIVVR